MIKYCYANRVLITALHTHGFASVIRTWSIDLPFASLGFGIRLVDKDLHVIMLFVSTAEQYRVAVAVQHAREGPRSGFLRIETGGEEM